MRLPDPTEAGLTLPTGVRPSATGGLRSRRPVRPVAGRRPRVRFRQWRGPSHDALDGSRIARSKTIRQQPRDTAPPSQYRAALAAPVAPRQPSR